MDYQELAYETRSAMLPAFAKNEHSENVVIARGKDDAGRFFKVYTSQKNGWLRINTYYENGDQEETYEK